MGIDFDIFLCLLYLRVTLKRYVMLTNRSRRSSVERVNFFCFSVDWIATSLQAYMVLTIVPLAGC